MRKSEFVKALARKFPELPESLVNDLSNKILSQIVATLKDGGRVEIRGFGTFSSSLRRARTIHNPGTRQMIDLPAKRIPRFKAGKSLSQKVDAKSP